MNSILNKVNTTDNALCILNASRGASKENCQNWNQNRMWMILRKLLTSSSYLMCSIMRMLSGIFIFIIFIIIIIITIINRKRSDTSHRVIVLCTNISSTTFCMLNRLSTLSYVMHINEEHLKCFNFAHPLTCERGHRHTHIPHFALLPEKPNAWEISSASALLSLWFYYTHTFCKTTLQKSTCMDGRIRSDPIWSKIYMTCKIHPIYTHNVGNFENFGAISRFLNENHFMQNVLLPLKTSIILYKYISSPLPPATGSICRW